jgi:hypothetical protein
MERLKALADEAEVTGQVARAQALHERRVALTDKANAQVGCRVAACNCWPHNGHGVVEAPILTSGAVHWHTLLGSI